MTPLRSRRLPQLTSKPSCAYSPLGVDAASTVWWARRSLFAGGVRVCGWSGSTGWGGQAVRTGGDGWGGQAVRTGSAGAAESEVAQSAVDDRCGGDAGAGAGALGDARKMHFFGQICTSRSHFPRSLLFKGANLPKPVHASRPRPTRIPPTPQTHPAHAPDAPRSRPILRCPTVQKPGRFAPQPPVSPARATQNTQSAGFLYPPHQIAPTGRNAPAI